MMPSMSYIDDLIRWRTRNIAIWEQRKKGKTLKAIGKKYGLSVERIRQIVKQVECTGGNA